MIGLVIALALAVQAPAPSLDPRAVALIAPVNEAMEAERKAQSTLPPPADDSERLVRMVRIEQAGRRAMGTVDFSGLSPEQRDAAYAAMWSQINQVDAANQAELLKMLPPEGWFYKSRYGPAAASAAFLIIQHSNVELWRRFVPVLEPLVAKGEVDGPSYALMFDRLALNEGRPQRYGSQMTCKAGHWVVNTLEAPETIDQRRAAIGLTEPLAEYEKHFANRPPC